MKLNFEFEISDAAFELLQFIQKNGYAEYRDSEFDSLESFKKYARESDQLTEEDFLGRNSNGTNYLIPELLRFNLISLDDMSWHQTYVLSDLGKLVLQQN